jgi:hypothetical protein
MLMEFAEFSTLPPLTEAAVHWKVYVPGSGIETGAAILSM